MNEIATDNFVHPYFSVIIITLASCLFCGDNSLTICVVITLEQKHQRTIMSAQNIVLKYVCPAFGMIAANIMFAGKN